MPASTRHSMTDKSSSHASPWKVLDDFIESTEAKLQEFYGKTAALADESHVKVRLGLMDLEDGWQRLQPQLKHQVDKLRQLEIHALAAVDEAQIQAHLAKADVIAAAERIRERLRLIERRLHAVKVKAESGTVDVLSRLSAACSELARRLEQGQAPVPGQGHSGRQTPESRV